MNFKSDIYAYIISSLLIIIIASPLILFKGSNPESKLSGYHSEFFQIPFAINNPDSVYILPEDLKEVSGLAYFKEEKLYAVNDEKGILYLYNLHSGEIESEIKFGKKGDYEALARKNNNIYISNSKGNITVVDIVSGNKIDEFKTSLSRKNNVEGICFDSTGNQLLIACKGKLKSGKNKPGKKGIYSLNLTTQELDKKPYQIVDLKEDLQILIPENIVNNSVLKLGLNTQINMFAPSGLAIDPITNNLYILANKGKLLIIIDDSKTLLGIYFLNQALFNQPEGIAFDEEGNLFISNEARASKANIVSLKRDTIEEKIEIETEG